MTEKLFNSLPKQSLFRYFVHVSLLILLTSFVFSNTLGNSFHLDGVYRVRNNTEINEFITISGTVQADADILSRQISKNPAHPTNSTLLNQFIEDHSGNLEKLSDLPDKLWYKGGEYYTAIVPLFNTHH